ncbi:MAG: hypothetical protein HRT61_24875 [Ekhidna sp.]|nr:hypothetical protein [Ekhidna sp.]
MSNKNHQDFQLNPLDQYTKTDADIVSSTPLKAREYLEEEGFDVDKEVAEGLAFIKGSLAKEKLRRGKLIHDKFSEFLSKLQNNINELVADFNARGLTLQVNFRSLEGELSKEEIERIQEDAAVATYLDQLLSEEDENYS